MSKYLNNYLDILEEQERIVLEKRAITYTEDDVETIKKLLKKNKKITDSRLSTLYKKLKEADLL
jgi:hypothetical protein